MKIVCLSLLLLMWMPLAGQDTLRARIHASPELAFKAVHLRARPPAAGWTSGMVSWVAVSKRGLIYELQRGDIADPIVVMNRKGEVLQSWGRGDFAIPHSIRIDAAGHIWTVDAGSS